MGNLNFENHSAGKSFRKVVTTASCVHLTTEDPASVGACIAARARLPRLGPRTTRRGGMPAERGCGADALGLVASNAKPAKTSASQSSSSSQSQTNVFPSRSEAPVRSCV